MWLEYEPWHHVPGISHPEKALGTSGLRPLAHSDCSAPASHPKAPENILIMGTTRQSGLSSKLKGEKHRVTHDTIRETWPTILIITRYRDSVIINI